MINLSPAINYALNKELNKSINQQLQKEIEKYEIKKNVPDFAENIEDFLNRLYHKMFIMKSISIENHFHNIETLQIYWKLVIFIQNMNFRNYIYQNVQKVPYASI